MRTGMDMPGSNVWISLPSISGKESVNWFPRATSTRAIRSRFRSNYSTLEVATMASEVFEAQVALLVRVLPYVATETCFALKGGTAINLFVRPLPRLSVDIDLVYLPIEDRETSLVGIRSALDRIAQKIRKAIPDSVVTDNANANGTLVLVRQRNAQIKIEVTPVLRGTVHPTRLGTDEDGRFKRHRRSGPGVSHSGLACGKR